MDFRSSNFWHYLRRAGLLCALTAGLAGVSQAQSTSLGAAPSPTVTYGTGQTFTATVTASGGGPATTGTVTFTDQTTGRTLASNVAVNGSGQASTTAVLGAGAHTILATYSGGGSSGTLPVTVNKATLTVSAFNVEIPYGVSPLLTFVETGFVGSDNAGSGAVTGVPLLTTNATLKNGLPVAGTWTITVSTGALVSANYTFSFVPATLLVDPAQLTVTPNNITVMQGTPLPFPLTYTITGFVNGDTQITAGISGAPLILPTATPDTAAPGTYPILALPGNLAAPNYTFTFAQGTITITPGVAATVTLTVTGGSSQSATVNKPFATPLQVTAYDVNGNVIPNAIVTFVAPNSGPSATIAQYSVTANAGGVASDTATANTVAGNYTVVAQSGTVTTAFQLTNTADVAATITAVSGTPQSAPVGTPFASALQVNVLDQFNNKVSGTAVTYSVVRSTNGGVTFPNGPTATTDSTGTANLTVIANSAAGTYTVAASAGAATGAVFNLTNTEPASLFAPALFSGNANQFGLAWTNPLSTPVTITATARAYDGTLITGSGIQNPVQIHVPAQSQLAEPTTQIFGSAITGRSGWVEFDTDTAGGSGFFLLYNSALSTADGGQLAAAPAGSLIFPEVNSGTTLYVVNTSTQAIPAIGAFFFDNSGNVLGQATLPLPAQGGWSGRVTDLQPSLSNMEGYAIFTTQGALFSNSVPVLVGTESYAQSSDIAVVAGLPPSAALHTGYAVHITSGGGYTNRVKLVNADSNPVQVQLTLNGTTVQATIPGSGRLDQTVDSLFSLGNNGTTAGYLTVQTPSTSAGVTGYVEFSGAGGSLFTAEPFLGETEFQTTFSQIAQGAGFFTGMAFLNPDPSQTANVTVNVNSAAGVTIASAVIPLSPGQRFVGLLTDVFPTLQTQLGGSIHISSSLPVYTLEIIGSTAQSNQFFANVAPSMF